MDRTLLGLVFLLVMAQFTFAEALDSKAVKYRPIVFDEKLVGSLAEYDRRMYESLPDRIDCEIQTYLENCEHINFMMKKHPDAPMRIPTSAGTEVVLQPDTPAAFADFILSPTAESAQKTLEFWRNQVERLNNVSDVMLAEIYEQGGVIPGNTEAEYRSQPRLSEFITTHESLRLVMVIESSCPACKYQLNILRNIQERFPNLDIAIYQIDDNYDRFVSNVVDQGLKGKILNPSDAKKLLARIEGWPYTRIVNDETEHQIDFYGSKPTQSLIQELAYVAKYVPPSEEEDS